MYVCIAIESIRHLILPITESGAYCSWDIKKTFSTLDCRRLDQLDVVTCVGNGGAGVAEGVAEFQLFCLFLCAEVEVGFDLVVVTKRFLVQ